MSMAGAWVAQGDDLSVMDHNPSQLVRQREITVELHYTGFVYNAVFDPAPVPGLGDGPATFNDEHFLNHIPNLYASFPIGDRFNIGTGLFTPIGPRHGYPNGGPQRYQVQDARVQLVWPTLAVAAKIIDQLSASLSVDFGYPWVTQTLAIGIFPGYRSLDGSVTIDGAGSPTPRGKLGILAEPVEGLTVGLVAAHGIDINVEGTISADVPQVGFDPATAKDNVVASQRYPTEFRFGVGWTNDTWRAEATTRYYRWSEYQQQTIDLENNEINGFTMPDLTVPKRYRDAMAFQVGGGYRPLADHEVRAGYMFDQAAANPKYMTLQDFDAPKHVFAVGYGYDFLENYQVNAGFNYWLYEDVVVQDSQSQAVGVLGDPPNLGNGRYDWRVQTFALSMQARF